LKTLVSLVRGNRYFFLPFIAWLAIGATLQIVFFSKEELFLGINSVHAPLLDPFFSYFTYVGDGCTFGLMIGILLLLRKYRLFLMAGLTLLVIAIIVQLIKHQLGAPRPMAYFPDTSLIHTVTGVRVHKSLSFPSGHTATAFGMFCFLAMAIRNKTASLVFFLLALTAAWSRIYLAQHFFEDVYIGSIIGTFSCMLIFFTFSLVRGKTPGTGKVEEPEPAIQPLPGFNAPA
jgi:membrane-associated phospholipid phosphatase